MTSLTPALLDSCGPHCGWVAALLASIAWGTYGVPLKLQAPVPVHFFVMQTYKTVVCFVTAWLVVFLGVEIAWSWWGLLSGIFWVPGASAGIYAIRQAGLAISVGTWASIKLSTSFLFAILVFHEGFRSIPGTLAGFVVLLAGLIGMSRYSDPNYAKPKDKKPTNTIDASTASETATLDSLESPLAAAEAPMDYLACDHRPIPLRPPLEVDEDALEESLVVVEPLPSRHQENDAVLLCGGRVVLTRRQVGVLGAVFNGAWGGLSLIPMHYASQYDGLNGASYLISFASGSMMVCAIMWMIYFAVEFVHVWQHHPREEGLHHHHHLHANTWKVMAQQALDALPRFYVSELGMAGVAAGLLYSCGNFCSILAVAYLGQGIGYSACQAQLLVSGLWGVFYFGEIVGAATIAKWFASATATLVAIVWLIQEHTAANNNDYDVDTDRGL